MTPDQATTEVSEEAVEAAREAAADACVYTELDEEYLNLMADAAARAAAPLIRKQERERFLALLDREIEVAETVSHRAHVNVLKSFRSAVVAAALEDPDGSAEPKGKGGGEQ